MSEIQSKKPPINEEAIRSVLVMFGFGEDFSDVKEYINKQFLCHELPDCEVYIKLIFSVRTDNGQRIVVKILREDGDAEEERHKIEKQSEFSEFLRTHGISTPKRFRSGVCYCREFLYRGVPCSVSTEEWCGEELTEITPDSAYRIGALLARMHVLSLENGCRIGCGTLFPAAYDNDVDAFADFCRLTEDPHLSAEIASEIRALRAEKLQKLRTMWDRLPKAAVQGDISINNLVKDGDSLTVFDYNNAGDEVLVSDLVLEGLLSAYEMELPDGGEESIRKELFPAFLRGYLSVRKLSEDEAVAAWLIYTLYHALWFSRILYREDSLASCLKRQEYDRCSRILSQMLADMREADDGRFRS